MVALYLLALADWDAAKKIVLPGCVCLTCHIMSRNSWYVGLCRRDVI